MNEIQTHIKQAFDLISIIPVAGDDVDRMAVAREGLRKAYALAEPEKEKEKEAETDG